MEDDDNNDDLEAELEALTSGDDSVSKPKQSDKNIFFIYFPIICYLMNYRSLIYFYIVLL